MRSFASPSVATGKSVYVGVTTGNRKLTILVYTCRHMPEKAKPVSTRLPKDTHAELEEYCEDHDISKADALRRFTEQQLKRETATVLAANQRIIYFGAGVVVTAIFLIVVTGV